MHSFCARSHSIYFFNNPCNICIFCLNLCRSCPLVSLSQSVLVLFPRWRPVFSVYVFVGIGVCVPVFFGVHLSVFISPYVNASFSVYPLWPKDLPSPSLHRLLWGWLPWVSQVTKTATRLSASQLPLVAVDSFFCVFCPRQSWLTEWGVVFLSLFVTPDAPEVVRRRQF